MCSLLVPCTDLVCCAIVSVIVALYASTDSSRMLLL